MKYKYNDYELLYLISEHSEAALEIMYEKYRPLIYARIKDFNIGRYSFDDFYQEGLLVLHQCIWRFSDLYNKTFTRFFEMCLQRRIMDILRVNSKYFYNTIIMSDLDYLKEEKIDYHSSQETLDDIIVNLSSLEKEVFELKYVYNYTIKEISEKLNVDVKKIYNALARIKTKIK